MTCKSFSLLLLFIFISVLSILAEARPTVRVFLLPLIENYTVEANLLRNISADWSNENGIDIEFEFSNTLLVTTDRTSRVVKFVLTNPQVRSI
ncbi:hypothetical protein BKA69DRAFT_1075205 [Paraphysoderma sedebokerense]|nr:hypothetical protein BKA69DRAFT_1075205 [Paraphysoderma sedebokerense]